LQPTTVHYKFEPKNCGTHKVSEGKEIKFFIVHKAWRKDSLDPLTWQKWMLFWWNTALLMEYRVLLIYVCTFICIYMYIFVCVHVRMCVWVCVCAYICISMYIHTHTRVHKDLKNRNGSTDRWINVFALSFFLALCMIWIYSNTSINRRYFGPTFCRKRSWIRVMAMCEEILEPNVHWNLFPCPIRQYNLCYHQRMFRGFSSGFDLRDSAQH